ncbi:MAG: ABC transporter substrate-binding protein [Dehalococcoidia bacterium]|nr:ABC transporter substrate-binding protein [Dehalococcoidia bacterium]MSQ34396.1 ABC transporter substrate-binding protein [Dehalococcoidia bacterium]
MLRRWSGTVKGLITVSAATLVLALAACGEDEKALPTPAGVVSQPTLTPQLPATARPPAAPAATSTRLPSPVATPPTPPAPTTVPTATPNPVLQALKGIPGIVDPANLGWPREIETDQGRVTLKSPPQRIHTVSLGHDEIIVALIGAKRLAGIGSFTADPIYSNVAADVKGLPRVKRDAEAILGLNPDIVIASKFTNQDLLNRIKGAGVPVARTNLESSSLGNIPNILLLGYMLGAEERANLLAGEIRKRIDAVGSKVRDVPAASMVRALSIAKFAETIDASGATSTEGGIIESAGAVNAAAEVGVYGHQTISLESIAAMRPDVIILTQPVEGGLKFMAELYASPALQDVPAVKNKRIVIGDSRYYTTLSHWNVRGIEESAKLFYPELFKDVIFKDFVPVGG